MKHSISKIFKNLNLFMLLALTLSIVSSLFITEQYYSYRKVEILTTQKVKMTKIIKNSKTLTNTNIIQINSDIAQMYIDVNKLINRNDYLYISKYIFPTNSEESAIQLNQLKSLIQDFDNKSRYYMELKKGDKDLIPYRNNMYKIKGMISHFIDSMIIKNISYDHDQFNLFSKIFAFLILVLVFINTVHRKNLSSIYSDILSLYSFDSKKKDKDIFSQEVDAINMRMHRKTQISDNPNMIDPITGINNAKGMLQSYIERKSIQSHNFSSVTVLEIDNFSKSQRAYSQDLTQEILKKVAYTISLHEKSSDIIARTDYNQFTLVFSGPSKEKLFKNVDLVRQSISEIKFTAEDKKPLIITVTGGFVLKHKNDPLEETIKKAKILLEKAKKLTKNSIFQTKDVPR